MLRKLLIAAGLRGSITPDKSAAPRYAPYANEAVNEVYNLLFCDEPAGFKPKLGLEAAAWQDTLFSEAPRVPALLALAGDPSEEGRVRYLAFARLRQLGETVPADHLLGVIVEVPLDGGLDVLAAFSEGGVRYINQTGKLAVFEGVASLRSQVRNLFAASESVVARIGPWDQPRRPPPKTGGVRLTFLVSDGLYFGEGPMRDMQREAMAGPVIQRATELLQIVVAMGTK